MSGTILDYLCRQDTNVQLRSRTTGSTRNPAYPEPREISCTEWLTQDHLNQMFHGKLKNILDGSAEGLKEPVRLLKSVDTTETEHPTTGGNVDAVHSEDNLKSLLDETIMHRVRQALQHHSFIEFLEQETDLRREGALGDSIMFFGRGTKRGPDFTGVRDVRVQEAADGGRGQPYCLLPGEVKLSSVWNSQKMEGFLKELESAEDKEARFEILEQMWPFRQLLKYCLESFSRYGWIMTDDELLLVRVHACYDGDAAPKTDHDLSIWLAKKRTHMEYFPVRWKSPRASDSFTICLALWFLHVLATNNGHLSREPYGDLLDEKRIPLHQQKRLVRSRPMSKSEYLVLQESSFEGEPAATPSQPTIPVKTRARAARGSVSQVNSFEVDNNNSFSLTGSFSSETAKRKRDIASSQEDSEEEPHEVGRSRELPARTYTTKPASSSNASNSSSAETATAAIPRVMLRPSERRKQARAQQADKRVRTRL